MRSKKSNNGYYSEFTLADPSNIKVKVAEEKTFRTYTARNSSDSTTAGLALIKEGHSSCFIDFTINRSNNTNIFPRLNNNGLFTTHPDHLEVISFQETTQNNDNKHDLNPISDAENIENKGSLSFILNK